MTATPPDETPSLSTDDQTATVVAHLRERIDTLAERVETLEAETDRLENTVDAQAARLDTQAEQLDQLNTETENLDERQTELEADWTQFETELIEEVGSVDDVVEGIQYGLEFGEFRPRVARNIAELRQAVTNTTTSDSTESESEGDGNDGNENVLTPIERVTRLDETEHGINVTPSVRRAAVLYENLSAWGTRTTKGYVLKTKDGLRDLLSAEMGERLSWKQVYRACRTLDTLAKGAVQYHRDNPRHGKMLVVPKTTDTTDATDRRRRSGNE